MPQEITHMLRELILEQKVNGHMPKELILMPQEISHMLKEIAHMLLVYIHMLRDLKM